MSPMIKLTVIAALMSAAVAPASATVLTFDDLGSGPVFFLANYNGFMFGTNNLLTTAWFHTDQTTPFYKARSGSGYIATDFQLYDNTNPYQATQAISNTTAFKFDGAWFSGGDTVGYQLFSGTTPVFTSLPSATLTATPTFVASGYSGLVTSVVVYGRQGFYALDDFTFNSTPAAVPEPESLALMLGGFGAMSAFVRRRKRAG